MFRNPVSFAKISMGSLKEANTPMASHEQLLDEVHEAALHNEMTLLMTDFQGGIEG